MRGRNRNKGPNPLTRSYESNGPDVKIRGTAQHIADKYAQLARDAQASGDPVAAENYLQHAEHYYRIIAAAQEQFREQFGGYQQRPFDSDDDEEGGFGQGSERSAGSQGSEEDPSYQPQPYENRPEGGEREGRFDRGNRGERFEGRDRFDRDRGGRDRFQRGDRNRQDFNRPDHQGREGPREGGRQEFRGDFRQDRQDRPDQPRFDRGDRRREEPEEGANGLPAFLTTPVRQPITMGEVPEGESAAAPNGEAPSEGNGRYRQRRRRRPRFEGGEAEGADFSPDTPAE